MAGEGAPKVVDANVLQYRLLYHCRPRPLEVSSRLHRIKGWTEAEIVGRHFAMTYLPDDVAAGKPDDDLARANALGRIEEESWRLRRDGSEFLGSVTLTALRDGAGALRGFGKVIRDITDQRAAEAALVRREHHLRSILATVPDAMIVMDEHGTVSSFSTAAEAMFGYAKADVIGRNVAMLVPPGERWDRPARALSGPGIGEASAIGRVQLTAARRANGEIFPAELAVGEASIAGERIFTGFVRDLTRRRETERKMAELQPELIHVSRVSAMGTMASTLAHEINQPLSAVTTYLETIRAMIGDPPAGPMAAIAEGLDLAAAQSLRAGAIVRRLRAFVDGADAGLKAERLDLLIEEATSLGLLDAREAGIRVTMTVGAGLHRVMVDRVQIQQVLINLIRNAIQAMVASPIRELAIVTALDLTGWARVTVADTGPGVDPGIRDRLFDAFATTKADGMGLGLSICRTIVEAHGGRIWAEAGAAGGTAFHFCVPLAASDDDA